MQMLTSPDLVSGISPRIVAQNFRVHLRTVFRWLERGWLESESGLIVTDYKTTILPNWNRSCSFVEAKKKLEISIGTLRNWRDKKILETVMVMGFHRVLLTSLEKTIQHRKAGIFSIHPPNYEFPNKVLKITGVGSSTLRKCLDNGTVPSAVINGRQMIPKEEVDKIKIAWQSSCRPALAEMILNKKRSLIRCLIKSGQLEQVSVLGKNRILRDSIKKAEYQDLDNFKRRIRRPLPKTKKNISVYLMKLQNQRLHGKGKLLVPDYQPRQVKLTGLESKRLTNCMEAAKATGKTLYDVENLYRDGKLRGETVDERVFIYILSLESFIGKLRRGEVR